MKRCKICELEKELSEFAIIRPKKSGGFTYSSRCKKCHAKLAYEARKKDPAKIAKDRQHQAEWLEKNKEHRKEYERKKAKEYWQKKKQSEGITGTKVKSGLSRADYVKKYTQESWAQKKQSGISEDERARLREANKKYRKEGKYKAWQDANKDKVKANNKKYRDAGKNREYVRKRRASDPDFVKKLNEYCRVRTLRRKAVGGHHTREQWEALKAQYDHKCLCCGKSEPEVELTRDHIIAITKGGTDDIENIQPLCRGCNAAKQANEIDFRN